jgi:hypothetical protein
MFVVHKRNLTKLNYLFFRKRKEKGVRKSEQQRRTTQTITLYKEKILKRKKKENQ